MALLTDAELLRIYRTREKVEEYKAYVDRLVAEAPPLTAGQKARLRVLMRHTNPPNALPAPAPSTQVAA